MSSSTTVVGKSRAVQKQWVRTWDLNTQDNWKDSQLPCGGKAALLTRYPQYPMFLGDTLILGSVELPVTGQLILGDGANMVFNHITEDSCQVAKWTHRGRDEWWDPDAWMHPDYDDPSTSPVPHVHRIPCTRDSAVFTNTSQSLYSVHLSPPAISITNLSIGSKNFTTSEFALYARTSEGMFRFVGASSRTDGAPLYVESPGICADVTGCLCGTEGAASTICSIMSAKCQQPQCNSPIDMTGFCCPVCGAEVTINHSGTLPLAHVVELLRDHLQSSAIQHVAGYAAKMDDGLFHIYFTAVNENGDYKLASKTFIIKFDQELNVGGSHEALVSYSGDIIPTDSQGVAPHNVAATFITLTICLVIGVTVCYFRKRRATAQLSFMFRRLESSSRRVSVVSDMVGGRRPSATSSIFTYSREGGLRFFNPIFNQSMASLAGAGLTSISNDQAQIPPGNQVEGQRENPMYTAYENMTPEERQASEDALRARERILEAAGELAASMESLSVHNKDGKIVGPVNDLEVIVEERETKNDTVCPPQVVEVGDEINDDKDPLGMTDVTSLEEGKNHVDVIIGNPSKQAKPENFEENVCTTTLSIQDESGSEKDVVSDFVIKDQENTESQQACETITGQEFVESEEIQVQPFSPLELSNTSPSSSSSSYDDEMNTLSNLEGFASNADLNFES
ncbi:uncharacterized protein [Panulirus ornatus]|uniref:uncharacterized protein isoform X2 n=1 Tax=Panulirus ornatus TaxID=150431 RepID=UPI003A893445